MTNQVRLSSLLGLAAAIGIAALPASADPILSVSTSTILLTPTTTTIQFDVDPNDTPLSAFVLNLSALATGLEIVSIQAEPGFFSSGPALNGSNYEAGFGGFFFPDRSTPFTVGTVTVEGFTSGTPLVASGEWTDATPTVIAFGPLNVATVVPEPNSLSLLSLGLLALALHRRVLR